MDLKEEAVLGDRVAGHWYYRSKAAAMVRALDGAADTATAVDVGAGSGYFARHLLERTGVALVDCVDEAYTTDGQEVVGGGRLRRRRRLDDAIGDADLVLLMDVLEHVEDDRSLLTAAADHLRPGGRVLVTVPAFSWLWSGHDEFLGHLRRYTASEVARLLADSGVEVDRVHYVFGLVFPAAVAQRLGDRVRPGRRPGSRLQVHGPVTNRVLGAVCLAETRVQRFNHLVGLTVLATGRRP